MPLEPERCHLLGRYLTPRLVVTGIEKCLHLQPAPCSSAPDQVHDGLEAHQRPASPVHADEGEEAVLDLVPLAGSGRVVTHRDRCLELVGQLLEMKLPGAEPIAVTPSGIGTDQQALGLWITPSSEHPPPPPDALDGELRRIVSHPNVHQRPVRGDVVSPIWNRLAPAEMREVMGE